MSNNRDAELWFGGDYSPEQWPDSRWADDALAFEALGVNTVTLPVFGWGLLQTGKDAFDFGWLDRVLESLTERGIGVVLATPTAAQPAWMSAAFPEILPVDRFGRRRRHGGRVNYCPTSNAYLEASARIAGVMAERYCGLEGLRLWHVNNEYGPTCYCDGCQSGFADWLAQRYGGLDELNDAWGTAVWSHTFRDWGEVELPSRLNDMGATARGAVNFAPNPSVALDHARFVSHSLLACFKNEVAVLREFTPDVPVTTNFHGPVQTVDWHEWAPHLDLVSWDSYPRADGHWAQAAFGHDLARCAGSRPEFLLMESSPGPVNWQDRNALKRPGVMRLEALQAIAHGSRGALYFSVRQTRAGAELHHSALIPRHGRLDTRAGAELIEISRDLRAIEAPAARHEPRRAAAVVFDWASWWAQSNTPGLDQQARYFDTVSAFHRTLAESNIATDVIGPGHSFDGYDLVVAPLLHVVSDELTQRLADYVAAGGTLISTSGSAIVGTDGRVHEDGIEPAWRELFGLWVEETDVQPSDVVNRVHFVDGTQSIARGLFDLVRTELASVVGNFTDDFYAGSPAVTVNAIGSGRAIYLCSPTPDLLRCLLGGAAAIVDMPDVERSVVVSSADPGSVELVAWHSDGEVLMFCLNHGTRDAALTFDQAQWIDVVSGAELALRVVLPGRGVLVASHG